MYTIAALFLIVFGAYIIFDGVMIKPDNLIGQIYQMLDLMVGAILLTGGCILSVVAHIYIELKNKNK